MNRREIKILRYFVDIFFILYILLNIFYALVQELGESLIWIIINGFFVVLFLLAHISCTHWLSKTQDNSDKGSILGKFETKDIIVVSVFFIFLLIIILFSIFFKITS